MKYIIIVAMGRHREIGRKNNLLWHLPKDMQFFKETTMGHPVVMGRKSWESIPEKFRPLPGRQNIVVSRDVNYQAEGATTITNLQDLDKVIDVENTEKCFIIGGAQIYQLALDYKLVTQMYITHVDETFEADTLFPYINFDYWDAEEVLKSEKDDKNPYSFTIKKYTL